MISFINSPSFVYNHMSIINSDFKRFSSTLFYNQKFLHIENSKFIKGLGSIVVNENDNSNIHQTISDQNFYIPLRVDIYDDSKRSISIINCMFSDIKDQNVIHISNGIISLYITSSTFISCNSTNSVIYLEKTRCLTITHICTLNSGSINEAAIVNHDVNKNDFSLFLYNTFVNSFTATNGGQAILVIKNGNQFYRCNNFTGANYRALSLNTPQCFYFSLSTIMKCSSHCFQLSIFQNECLLGSYKIIEMSNLFCNAENLLEIDPKCDFDLQLLNCVVLNNHQNAKLAKFESLEYNLHITLRNCIVLNSYHNDDGKVEFIDCTKADYDEQHVTLHAHYTHGDECVGPENTDNKENGCDSVDCIDKNCNNTIGFPDDVVSYTTFCHDCTPLFSKTSDFSESLKFSGSLKFSESLKFFGSLKFPESLKFSGSLKFSQSTMFSDSSIFTPFYFILSSSETESAFSEINETFSSDVCIDPGILGITEKGTKKAMIGAITGVIAAFIIAAIIATVIIIKKRKRMNITTDADMVETKESFTTKNNLSSIMNEDDPFAEEFKGDENAL